jgi:hypothetical protein
MRKQWIYLGMALVTMMSCQRERSVQGFVLEKRLYKFDHEIRNELEKDTVPWKAQMAVNKYTSKGNYQQALIEWDGLFRASNRTYAQEKIDSLKRIYTPINAKKAIVEGAKNTRVTILNEAHHNSFHRLFAKSLLKDLYDQGYRHLGLEALDNEAKVDTLLNERGYPITSSGYYTQDPNFSLFIREAIRLGYHVFPYEENVRAKNKFREIEQAKNIQKEMEKYPEDKFLIYCGFDHVFEGAYGRKWEKAMAERLKEFTQVDPLTINQTGYSPRSTPEKNHPLLKVFGSKESIVLKDQQGDLLGYTKGKAFTDIAVFHPAPNTIDGRLMAINATENQLSLKGLQLEFPVMLWVFEAADDVRSAVPIYIGEILEAQEQVVVPLVSGSYSFALVQENNTVLIIKDKI